MENSTDTLQPIRQAVANYSVLNHPFYQDWNKGRLTKKLLQQYATQYYPHVKAFPQYLSRLHSHCPTDSGRQMLLGNLNEEEAGDCNHPELWRRFAEGLGVKRTQLEGTINASSQELYQKFFKLCGGDYPTGLGALYAYESQVPEVAEIKIDGLKKHYGVTDERSLAFFKVHQEADVHHRREF